MASEEIKSAYLHYSTVGFLNLPIFLILENSTVNALTLLFPLLVYIYRKEKLDIATDQITEMIIAGLSYVLPYIMILPSINYLSEKGWKEAYGL